MITNQAIMQSIMNLKRLVVLALILALVSSGFSFAADPNSKTLDVYKTDNMKNPLAGAIFQIDKAADVPAGNLTFTKLGTATSQANGLATFSDINIGNGNEEFVFRVTEVAAPQGYIKSSNVLYFFFDRSDDHWRFLVAQEQGAVVEDVTLLGKLRDAPEYFADAGPFINIPALFVDKDDQAGQPLAGAQFKITAMTHEYVNGKDQIKVTKAQDDVFSAADGKVTFDQLMIDPYGSKDLTYFMVEEANAPDGYIKSDQKLYFYFNPYGKNKGWMMVPEEFVETDLLKNEAEHIKPYADMPFVNLPVELNIYKVDQNDNPLAGANFEAVLTTSPSSIATATSDANGHAVFSMLADGVYDIRETAAPSGYSKSNQVYQVSIKSGVPSFVGSVPTVVIASTSSGSIVVTPGAITVTPGAIVTTHAAIKFINTKDSSSGGSGGSSGGNPTDNPTTTTVPILNREDHFAYIQGYPDGMVKPENNVTRQEVAAIFFRLLTSEYRESIRTTVNPFSDVSQALWSNKHISTLANGQILQGYPDGLFRPNSFITRGELAAIVTRFDDLPAAEYNFNDESGHWAESYIASAAAKGWINGYPDGSFKPDKYITRAELVTLINNVLGRNVKPEDILPEAKKFPDVSESDWFYTDIMIAVNSYLYEALPDNYQKWIEIIYPVIEM